MSRYVLVIALVNKDAENRLFSAALTDCYHVDQECEPEELELALDPENTRVKVDALRYLLEQRGLLFPCTGATH